MRVCLMIEGQEDVSWEAWLELAAACEDSGLDALFRSDHYLSVMGHTGRGSLDAWATIAALAAETSRIRLGTLVSPATFRHPSVLAKMVVTADHVSRGRVELGLGAGWLEPEHQAYGFAFPSLGTRMDVMAEQLEIIHRSWGPDPVSFEGLHYTVTSLQALPKPLQHPHPPLIVGGDGGSRSAGLAAMWADEYNTNFAAPEECRRRRRRVEAAFEKRGRPTTELRFSLMTGCIVGEDRAQVLSRARRVMERRGEHGDVDDWLAQHPAWVVGTLDEAVSQLAEFERAGVERVMLQHLLHHDLDMVRFIGDEVAPRVR